MEPLQLASGVRMLSRTIQMRISCRFLGSLDDWRFWVRGFLDDLGPRISYCLKPPLCYEPHKPTTPGGQNNISAGWGAICQIY
jgi:hypothetical protein